MPLCSPALQIKTTSIEFITFMTKFDVAVVYYVLWAS